MSSIDVHPLSAYDNEKDSEKAMGHETNVAVVAVAALHDPVFGDLEANGPNYRDVGWLGTAVLMVKATIGLGVLGIPYSLQTLGFVPGILALIAVEIIVTWAGYVLGQFKRNHPEVYTMGDAGRVMFGRAGEIGLDVAWMLYMIFCTGMAMVSISTSLNAVSMHGTCTAVFIAVAAVVGLGFGSIRTLGKITFLGWIGVASITASIITMTVAVGIQDRPADAPKVGPWEKNAKAFGDPTFPAAMSAVSSFLLASAATPTFFGMISEMRDPRMYTRALCVAQGTTSCFYIIIGSIVYHFCGQYVAYPALGSAGPLMKKVCYGLAIPALVVTLTIYLHLPAKFVFVRLLRGSEHLSRSTPTHWITWFGCTISITIVAYIIASSIPIFSSLMGLIGASLCPFVSVLPTALMWLHDNWFGSPRERTLKVKATAAFAVFVFATGLLICGGGTYGAVMDIISSESARPWSCLDNSNSVSS